MKTCTVSASLSSVSSTDGFTRIVVKIGTVSASLSGVTSAGDVYRTKVRVVSGILVVEIEACSWVSFAVAGAPPSHLGQAGPSVLKRLLAD